MQNRKSAVKLGSVADTLSSEAAFFLFAAALDSETAWKMDDVLTAIREMETPFGQTLSASKILKLVFIVAVL